MVKYDLAIGTITPNKITSIETRVTIEKIIEAFEIPFTIEQASFTSRDPVAFAVYYGFRIILIDCFKEDFDLIFEKIRKSVPIDTAFVNRIEEEATVLYNKIELLDEEFTQKRLAKCSKINKKTFDEIDEGMIPVITILNEKNYKTGNCCEGHTNKLDGINKRWNAYISFQHIYDFVLKPPADVVYNGIGNRPDCYHVENRENSTAIYWWGSIKGTIEEKEQERQQFMHDLLDWAKALPECVVKDRSYYYLYGIGARGARKCLATSKDVKFLEREKKDVKYSRYKEFYIERGEEIKW